MSPLIRNGDIVIGAETPVKALRRGNIVICRQADKFIIHRLIRINSDAVFTLGDAFGQTPEKIRITDILGKVITVLRHNNHYKLTRFNELMSWSMVRTKNVIKKLLRYNRNEETKITL
ncbi:MAG: hypothetical protein A2096_11095 [Spirochaetes bacterium GWF1_41_5]|nr:MAG: hypothetical protein A2096_11095 [Spirochaetes bacterium GWF1_41_5]